MSGIGFAFLRGVVDLEAARTAIPGFKQSEVLKVLGAPARYNSKIEIFNNSPFILLEENKDKKILNKSSEMFLSRYG